MANIRVTGAAERWVETCAQLSTPVDQWTCARLTRTLLKHESSGTCPGNRWDARVCRTLPLSPDAVKDEGTGTVPVPLFSARLKLWHLSD